MYLQLLADNRTLSDLFACAPSGRVNVVVNGRAEVATGFMSSGNRFGGSPDVVGTPVNINNVPVTIVGVLPPEFTGVEQAVSDAPDVSLPLALEPQFNVQGLQLSQPTFWWLHVMGRLKPGVTTRRKFRTG